MSSIGHRSTADTIFSELGFKRASVIEKSKGKPKVCRETRLTYGYGSCLLAGRLWFSAIERVVERLDGVYLRVFFGDRHGQDSDLVIVR